MIIQRYIARELMLSFSGTLFVLLLIIVGNTFVKLLSKISSGEFPVDVLGELVVLASIGSAIKLVPAALLIGMMLAFGRLYKDHEISALHSAGVGPKEFYKGIFLFVGPLTLIMSILVLFVTPTIVQSYQDITNDIKKRPEASGISVGEFMHVKSKRNSVTLFVEDIDEENTVMQHIFVHLDDGIDKTTITGKKALLYINPDTGGRIFKLENGSRYDDKKGEGLSIFRFSEHGIHIPSLQLSFSRSLESESFRTLLRNDDLTSKAEIHWRLALILSGPIMALLAFPLSYTTPRQGRFGKLAVGILLYAVYANLVITGQSMIEDGRTPNWLGLWWVHITFISLSLWLVRRQYSH